MMDAWFAEVLDEQGQPHDRIAVDGRVALLLCDGPAALALRVPRRGATSRRNSSKAMRASSIRGRPRPGGVEHGAPADRPRADHRGGRARPWSASSAGRSCATLLLWLLFAAALAAIFYLTR